MTDDRQTSDRDLLLRMQNELPGLIHTHNAVKGSIEELEKHLEIMETQAEVLKERGGAAKGAELNLFSIRRAVHEIIAILTRIDNSLTGFINSVSRGLARQGDNMQKTITFLQTALFEALAIQTSIDKLATHINSISE